jgi:phosphate transport system permease protein
MAPGTATRRRVAAFGFTRLMQATAGAVCLFLGLVVVVLVVKASRLGGAFSLAGVLLGTDWNPSRGAFGFGPVIVGSVLVTALAMALAIPVSILSAVFIAEYLPGKARSACKSFVDVLAGIPSVVYGMCGIIVLVPAVRQVVAPLFGQSSTGFCVLSAGVVLAVMVFPIIISVCVDCFRAVPQEIREISFSVGATKWEVTRLVAFRAALPGVFSAVLLGFGRAFGETIAVAMVVGNLPRIPKSIFDSAATLPSIIATTYGELMSVPLYDAALMLMALVLIVVVLIFNYIARAVKRNFERMLAG